MYAEPVLWEYVCLSSFVGACFTQRCCVTPLSCGEVVLGQIHFVLFGVVSALGDQLVLA